jgi:hypothetical protein
VTHRLRDHRGGTKDLRARSRVDATSLGAPLALSVDMPRTLPLVLLAACAAAPPKPAAPGSRGLRASDHLDVAHDQDELARNKAAYPDLRPDGTGRVEQAVVGIPWTRTWDTVADHERLAAIHRGAAEQLYAEYDEACGSRSYSEVSVSPIERYGIGGTSIADGVTIYLSPEAGPPDKLLADMRCHRAWMMLAPTNMDACPLDLAGLKVSAKGDDKSIEVTITIADQRLVEELQRRTVRDLEAGHAAHHAH